MDLPLGSRYETIDDAEAGLSELENELRRRGDRRAVFVTAYLTITREIKGRIQQNWFEDCEWVARYLISFANLYRDALVAYEQGDLEKCPKPWQIAFDTAANGKGLVIQHLLLGVNAHINHDLPLALLEVTIDPERDVRYKDHTAVNTGLQHAVGALQSNVATLYAPVLNLLSWTMGSLDEELAMFSVDKARESAWFAAVALANAHDENEQTAIRRNLNEGSAMISELILNPMVKRPEVLQALQFLEKNTPVWQYFMYEDVERKKMTLFSQPTLQVTTIHGLIEKLDEITAYYDARQSKLAIFPAAYAQVMQRLRHALHVGDYFADNDWIRALNLDSAQLYLATFDAYRENRLEEIPDCWRVVFNATAQEATVLQNLLMAISVHLSYDLAIALYRMGMTTAAQKRNDIARMHTLIEEYIADLCTGFDTRYSGNMLLEGIANKHMSELLLDYNYGRARDVAWEYAARIATAPTQEERNASIYALDRQATALAQKMLLHPILSTPWIFKALQNAEQRYTGNWSDWIR